MNSPSVLVQVNSVRTTLFTGDVCCLFIPILDGFLVAELTSQGHQQLHSLITLV